MRGGWKLKTGLPRARRPNEPTHVVVDPGPSDPTTEEPIEYPDHSYYASTRAFPGAEGYGANATGGRGGVKCFVTTLSDDKGDLTPVSGVDNAYEGSFRACWEGRGLANNTERYIIPLVSGYMEASERIRTDWGENDNWTYWGHFAPSPGLTIRYPDGSTPDYSLFDIRSSNFIVRFLRARGQASSGTDGNIDTVASWDGSDIIYDHCSVSWGVDSTFDQREAKGITVQWCLVYECLYDAGHPEGDHARLAGFGGSGEAWNLSWHHNLSGGSELRNPSLDAHGHTSQFENNFSYNGDWFHNLRNVHSAADNPHGCVFRHNLAAKGPWADDDRGTLVIAYENAEYYVENNFDYKRTSSGQSEDLVVSHTGDGGHRLSDPFDVPAIRTNTNVLENAQDLIDKCGATIPARDAVDEEFLSQFQHALDNYPTRGNQGSSPTSGNRPEDNLFFPALAENTQSISDWVSDYEDWKASEGYDGLGDNDTPISGSDYTVLELYANSLVPEMLVEEDAASEAAASEYDLLAGTISDPYPGDSYYPTTRAFPSAQGYGAASQGARADLASAEVRFVTNLNDAGSGSLRAALETSGPAVVIPLVSGMIELTGGGITVSDEKTFLGNFCPSVDGGRMIGIAVRNMRDNEADGLGDGIRVEGNDVIIRFLRSYPGFKQSFTDTSSIHAFNTNDAPGGGYSHRVIVDHFNAAFSNDETVSNYHSDKVTFSHVLATDPVHTSSRSGDGDHGYGTFLVGEDASYFASMNQRSDLRQPYAAPYNADVTVDCRNIINYNVEEYEVYCLGRNSNQAYNFMGFYAIEGPIADQNNWGRFSYDTAANAPSVYQAGHAGRNMPGSSEDDAWANSSFQFGSESDYRVSDPNDAPSVRTLSASNARDFVYHTVGCSWALDPSDGSLVNIRDELHQAVLSEALTNTGPATLLDGADVEDRMPSLSSVELVSGGSHAQMTEEFWSNYYEPWASSKGFGDRNDALTTTTLNGHTYTRLELYMFSLTPEFATIDFSDADLDGTLSWS